LSKGKKVIIIVVPIVVVFVFLIAVVGSQPYVNKNIDEIAGLTQFHVIKDGTITKLRFSFVDDQGYVAASDATVHVKIYAYDQEFSISANDFKQYRLQLTGQPLIAYAWQTTERIGRDTYVQSNVTLPNGKQFTASDRVFL
jgi:hypothetical protein